MSTPNDQEFNDDRLGRIVSGLVVDMGDIALPSEVARDARLITFDLGVQYLREIMGDIKGNIAKYEVARDARLITL